MATIFDLFNDEFFKGMLDDSYNETYGNEVHCPCCGMTYSQFNRTGKFGCYKCYETFDTYIEPLVKRIQGSLHYEGRVPARGSGVLKTKYQIKKLRQELEKAVSREDFEKAMILRDQIREFEKMLAK